MWKPANFLLQSKEIQEKFNMHYSNINKARPMIDTKAPWKSSHSLSKFNNKYQLQKESKIYSENQLLLNRMMEIEKKYSKNKQNPQIRSIAGWKRKQTQIRINQQNRAMLGRLESVKSSYGKEIWLPNFQQNLEYKNNLTRATNPNLLQNRDIKTAQSGRNTRGNTMGISSNMYKSKQI